MQTDSVLSAVWQLAVYKDNLSKHRPNIDILIFLRITYFEIKKTKDIDLLFYCINDHDYFDVLAM